MGPLAELLVVNVIAFIVSLLGIVEGFEISSGGPPRGKLPRVAGVVRDLLLSRRSRQPSRNPGRPVAGAALAILVIVIAQAAPAAAVLFPQRGPAAGPVGQFVAMVQFALVAAFAWRVRDAYRDSIMPNG